MTWNNITMTFASGQGHRLRNLCNVELKSFLFEGQQRTSFLRITYVILRMKTAWCTKCRNKRTIFYHKYEVLKCSYCKHLDNIWWNGFGGSVSRVKKKLEADSCVVWPFGDFENYMIYSRISNTWLHEMMWLSKYVTLITLWWHRLLGVFLVCVFFCCKYFNGTFLKCVCRPSTRYAMDCPSACLSTFASKIL